MIQLHEERIPDIGLHVQRICRALKAHPIFESNLITEVKLIGGVDVEFTVVLGVSHSVPILTSFTVNVPLGICDVERHLDLALRAGCTQLGVPVG